MKTNRNGTFRTNQFYGILKFIKYMLRVGIACTFIGHGMNALAVKQNWVPLLTVYGFSVAQAKIIMPWIGILDMIVAFLVLIRPFRAVVIWAVFWTFATALTRFIAGEGVWEFIERAANWSAPLALLLISKLEIVNQQTKWVKLSQNLKEERKFPFIHEKISIFFVLLIFTSSGAAIAQTITDTTAIHLLQLVETEDNCDVGIKQLESSINETFIYSGKKPQIMPLSKTNLALTENRAYGILIMWRHYTG